MKKLIFLLMFCLTVPVLAGTGTGRTAEVDLVFDKTVVLRDTSVGGTYGDTLLMSSDVMNIWCDTLSFILEVTGDSARPATHNASATFTFSTLPTRIVRATYDSVWADVKLQTVSPSGLTVDTVTFNGLIAVLSKGFAGCAVVFGSKLSIPESVTKGKLWIKACQAYQGTNQNVRIRMYRVRKWAG